SDYSARVCKEIHMRYTPLAGLLLLCHHVGTVQVTIERSSRQLLVDGQRFFARGVAYTPIPVGSDYGDYLGASQAAIWTQDLELMKAMNLNAIRAYTFDSVEDHTAFLDACDERGLLVAVTLDYPED
ncbi:1, partial [Durusdinium trenchii]